jgi:hypothetical protein
MRRKSETQHHRRLLSKPVQRDVYYLEPLSRDLAAVGGRVRIQLHQERYHHHRHFILRPTCLTTLAMGPEP